MCAVLLPPGVNPIAVKYIYHIVSYILMFQVNYGFNCGSGAVQIASERTYNDGQWHSVTFSRLHTSGNLSIDNEIVGQGSSKGQTKSINILSPYYVGGISPNISSDVKTNIKV
jgi:laminin alpha 3/5